MKSGFDYKEFKKWAESLKITENEFRKWLEIFLINKANDVRDKAQDRQSTYHYINAKGLEKIGVVDTGAMLNLWYVKDVVWNGNDLSVEIGNNAEYASYIELGHRSFKPVYLLHIPIDEIQRNLPVEFNKEWIQFLKDKGVV